MVGRKSLTGWPKIALSIVPEFNQWEKMPCWSGGLGVFSQAVFNVIDDHLNREALGKF